MDTLLFPFLLAAVVLEIAAMAFAFLLMCCRAGDARSRLKENLKRESCHRVNYETLVGQLLADNKGLCRLASKHERTIATLCWKLDKLRTCNECLRRRLEIEPERQAQFFARAFEPCQN
jgi:hypothetical protein